MRDTFAFRAPAFVCTTRRHHLERLGNHTRYGRVRYKQHRTLPVYKSRHSHQKLLVELGLKQPTHDKEHKILGLQWVFVVVVAGSSQAGGR